MSTPKPKRNDPCPCGSGKVYKHCCKPSRREQQQRGREIALAPALGTRPDSGEPSLPAQFRSLFHDLRHHARPGQAEEFEQLLVLAEEVAAYEEMRDAIEAAAQALEAHRAEFAALDLDAAADLASRLFAEERFRPLRYTAQDVHRAFEAVGYPRIHGEPMPQDGEILRDAILHLADRNLRLRLSRKLLTWLPEYVAAGRYLDAWLIQYCALQMLEAPNKSNPFLDEMFHHGFDEWLKQVETQQQSLLRELGLDPSELSGMSPLELEAWLQAKMADPETRARSDAYLDAHPMLSEQVQAEYWELQRASLQLLERDNLVRSLLAPEEVEPWTSTLRERLASIEERAMAAAEQEAWDDPNLQKDVGKVLFEVSKEMAPAIFAPERLHQLVVDLKAYRHELAEAGQKKFAMYAHVVSTSLEGVEAPAEEPFVIALCMASLRLRLISLGAEADALEEIGKAENGSAILR